MKKRRDFYLTILGFVIIFALAFTIRLGAINNTVIDSPIRADAFDYYSAAMNLKTFSVFSSQQYSLETPEPDAKRPPGYPLFLTFLVEHPPTKQMLWKVSFFQILLDSISVLLAISIFRFFLPSLWAFGCGLLVAISPHLISATTYLLTETLFTFLMICFLYFYLLASTSDKKRNSWFAFLAGIFLACATLTRPTIQYFIFFIVFLSLYHLGWKQQKYLIIALSVGFTLLISSWMIRNYVATGSTSNPSLAINTLHHGMYPNFMYKEIPHSHGYPYKFNPDNSIISSSMSAVTNEIARRFAEEPARHIKWYLVGKPITLFSWDIIAGMGDIFIYPVKTSPYFSNLLFTVTHDFMKAIHWTLTLFAFIALILVWFKPISVKCSKNSIISLRLFSVLIIYFTALHIVGAPFPRYSIPIRPIIYGLAVYFCYFSIYSISDWIKARGH